MHAAAIIFGLVLLVVCVVWTVQYFVRRVG